MSQNPDRAEQAWRSGMSDAGLQDERAAQQVLAYAVRQMKEAITFVNMASAVVRIDPHRFTDFCFDDLPSQKTWDEAIAEARKS